MFKRSLGRTYFRKRIFAYSDRVNLDTSQKLYQNNGKNAFFGCIHFIEILPKWGYSYICITGESKPYTADIEMRLHFLFMLPHTLLTFNSPQSRRRHFTIMDNPIERFREELCNMDCEVNFPTNLQEAEALNEIVEHIERGEIWQSDLRKAKEWQIFPWLVRKITKCHVKVNLIEGK